MRPAASGPGDRRPQGRRPEWPSQTVKAGLLSFTNSGHPACLPRPRDGKGGLHMARKDTRPEVSRRKFLAGVAVSGAAVTATSTGASAAAPPVAAARVPSALPPSARQVALEAGVVK